MKDGYKIADVDAHRMEPGDIFRRHIDARYNSAAPRPGSGERTFLVEGEPFTRAPKAACSARKALIQARRAGGGAPDKPAPRSKARRRSIPMAAA